MRKTTGTESQPKTSTRAKGKVKRKRMRVLRRWSMYEKGIGVRTMRSHPPGSR